MGRNLQSALDEFYMAECLTLAVKGAGYVSPNPMVGAVIVKNGRIIGRGYHQQFGRAHAEVHALKNARDRVRGATLYVNLEPCNFYGKTPPCTDAIISSRISRVVVGTIDENPVVAGKGIHRLRRAGIIVTVGVLEDECRKLNESFFKFIRHHTPFVTLKVAQTLDGKIADERGTSKWITNRMSRALVHQMRSRYDAVLVGARTVIVDNPQLTVRKVKGRNPVRIILSKSLEVSPEAKVFSGNGERILFTDPRTAGQHAARRRQLVKRGTEIIDIPADRNGKFPIPRILESLGRRGISSLLVEGGASTYSAFLHQRCVDKILFFVAPKVLGNGLDAFGEIASGVLGKEVKFTNVSSWNLDGDILIEAYVKK
ncbi:MAG: bifunctional diaminohydroxyphosphoribosylaminopyrimidine deaminase/5-amino-6-(5-phosphoribosylamino)uracil reductase RibD [Bacteroidota bacterium]|jgi:diaminohydroxyphosphoribosylaminopyrimidine deaminase/5-amino-6-(5-phosphoribosylamino)uracil reductase